MDIKPIAKIINDYDSKFAVPRQSGLVNDIKSTIVFEKEYSDESAFKRIEEFSHLWLIWGFSLNSHPSNSLTVRPPRLGGNEKVGVFATRSPFRPNPLGLSSVKLEAVEKDESGKIILIVSGADLVSGTPIYDIKPYITFSDCHPDAISGFAEKKNGAKLNVEIDDELEFKKQANFAVCCSAMFADADAIIAVSEHAVTPSMLSSFKPACPIYVITANETTYRQMAVEHDVTAVYIPDEYNFDTIL